MKFCSKCGAKLSDDAMFCSGCGTKQGESLVLANEGEESNNIGTSGKAGTNNIAGGKEITADSVIEAAGNLVGNAMNTVNTAIKSEQGQKYMASISKLSNIAYVAAIAGAASVFFPVVSLGKLGGGTVMQESKLVGLLIIAIALLGAYGVNVKKMAYTLASGQVLLFVGILEFVAYHDQVSSNAGKVFAVGYDWGLYLSLLSGVLLMLLSGFISLAMKQIKPDVGGAVNEIKSLETSMVEINGARANVLALTIILIAALVLGTALSD